MLRDLQVAFETLMSLSIRIMYIFLLHTDESFKRSNSRNYPDSWWLYADTAQRSEHGYNGGFSRKVKELGALE